MSTDAGPALSRPIRIVCAGLGLMISWATWGISANWPATERSMLMRALAALVLGAPFLALAAFGAGRAELVPEAGEEALEAARVRAHPWQARLKWLLTVAAGVYGTARAGAALAAGRPVPVDSIAACVVGALMAAALVVRWRARQVGRIAAHEVPSSLRAPMPGSDASARRATQDVTPRRGAP